MRHVNVKLDDATWLAFERLKKALGERRGTDLHISTVLRLVIEAGIEAHDTVMEKLGAAPIQPAKPAHAYWKTYISGPREAAEKARRTAEELFAAFNRHCDQLKLTPHDVAAKLAAIDPSLDGAATRQWYYNGRLPSKDDGAKRLLGAVETWLRQIA